MKRSRNKKPQRSHDRYYQDQRFDYLKSFKRMLDRTPHKELIKKDTRIDFLKSRVPVYKDLHKKVIRRKDHILFNILTQGKKEVDRTGTVKRIVIDPYFKKLKRLVCKDRHERRKALFKFKKIGRGKGGSKQPNKWDLTSRIHCKRR